MPDPLKICMICGEDCAGRPRIKDPKGHYYHRECHEEASRKQEAMLRAAPIVDPLDVPEEPEDAGVNMLDELLDGPAFGASAGAAGVASADQCPYVGFAAAFIA